MYRKLFIILLLCCYPLVCLQAQTTEEKTEQYAISVEPYQLANGGLRVNLEKKIHSTDWLELNLTGYYLPHKNIQSSYYDYYVTLNSEFESISGLAGLGIGATYKHYFFRHFMVNTAVSYNGYNVEYSGYNFYPYTEEGLTFYDYKRRNNWQTFHKLSLHIAIGVRSTFRRAIFVEPYIGLGVAYSFYDENKRSYSDTMFGYGYRGLYLAAGFKLGVNLRGN